MRMCRDGLANMSRDDETAMAAAAHAFRRHAGRWPSPAAPDPKERSLGTWLGRQRRQAAKGELDVFRRHFLDVNVPGWETDPDQRWESAARDLADFTISFGRLPALEADESWERGMAAWVAMQRSLKAQGSLRDDRARWLDLHCPGWLPAGSADDAAAHIIS